MRWAAALVMMVVVLAGCSGGDEGVPADAVAVVAGTEIPKSELDVLLAQARKDYENQKRDFPKAGSAELQTLKNRYVQLLVQREQFEQKAEDLEIEVTDEQVDARLAQIQKQYFGGDKKKYEAQLKEQGLTEAQVRKDIRGQIISEKIFANVTREVKVTEEEIDTFYVRNSDRFSQPASREVRHILVRSKATADDVYAQLKAGGDFAALAKKLSQDTGSKDSGGKLTIAKGQTVPSFDKTAFELKVDELSTPVKTEFGYHVIQALGPVKPATTPPLQEVQAAIRQQLGQTKKNEAMTEWVEELKQEYEDEIEYATGFSAPPEPAASTAATTSP